MSELSNGTKKHTSKSRETIPLNSLTKKPCPQNLKDVEPLFSKAHVADPEPALEPPGGTSFC
jgi:hypothetical protein